MSRPVRIWIVYGLCVMVVFAGVGYVSSTALSLDRARAKAAADAAFDENVRLAMWRMESALAPLVARENARPYFEYTSFYAPGRAYTRMFAALEPGEVLIPSPLLGDRWPYILLYFQLGPDGALTSPQVTEGDMLKLIAPGSPGRDDIAEAKAHLAALASLADWPSIRQMLPGKPDRRPPSRVVQADSRKYQARQTAQQITQDQLNRDAAEWQARNVLNVRSATQLQLTGRRGQQVGKAAAEGPSYVAEGLMRPLWSGDALLLARRVSVNGADYLQGCRLDWPAIQVWLLEEVRDLLPEAALEPATADESAPESRLLAALPARLLPGPAPEIETPLFSPVVFSLVISSVCVLLAAVGGVVVLGGSVSLSQRRGAFVSAVTHELRTPLTTFRLYTEMLSEGMVADDEKRRQYLETIRLEAERLSHLVENVLAYARLEHSGRARLVETAPLAELLESFRDRLEARARQAEMTLVVETAAAPDAEVSTDSSQLLQVLYNLVDNACKYAAGASDRRIHIRTGARKDYATISVRDHGPGIAKPDLRRLFRPFSKSAETAAQSAPGVGLGLALSRRLARSMGGDLQLDPKTTGGACFVLLLPL